MASGDRILVRLRSLCLKLPEVRETKTFGNPTFQAGKKTFAVLDEYHGTRCICFKTTPAEQRRLVKDSRFFVAPYGGKHGWTCLDVGRQIDWVEMEELLLVSYRLIALKRMLKALDG